MFDFIPQLIVITAFFLVLGSLFDVKFREVPDIYTIGPGIIAIGVYIIGGEWYSGLIGGGIFFVLGYYLFAIKAWGGADAKTLGSIGAVIGFNPHSYNLSMYLIILFLVGGLWYIFYWYILKDRARGVPFIPAFLISFLLFLGI